MRDVVYTIGHSNHPLDKLVGLLTQHGVNAVADVRSHPYSRFNPQFNRKTLSASLTDAEISYSFLGRELGARSDDDTCYVDGKVQYELLARTSLFQAGLAQVARDAAEQRVALLCAEKDPLTCHRAILVCPHLEAHGIIAQHIREDGRLESRDEFLLRLLGELRLEQHDMFRDRDELLAEAYRRRGREIAYVKKAQVNKELSNRTAP